MLGKDPLMQLWPTERADQEVLWWEEGWGWGGFLGRGLFSCLGPIVPFKEAGAIFVGSRGRLMRC